MIRYRPHGVWHRTRRALFETLSKWERLMEKDTLSNNTKPEISNFSNESKIASTLKIYYVGLTMVQHASWKRMGGIVLAYMQVLLG